MRATEMARKMVTSWGLSSLGPLTFGEEEAGEVFLGRSVNQRNEVSDKTAEAIDAEVRSIIDRNYARAKEILVANIDTLHLMAKSLIKYETIDSPQIQEIMSGNDPTPPVGWVSGGHKPNKPAQTEDSSTKSDKEGGMLKDIEEKGIDGV